MYVHKNALCEPIITNKNLHFWTVRNNNSFIYTFSLGTITLILKLISTFKAVPYYSAIDARSFLPKKLISFRSMPKYRIWILKSTKHCIEKNLKAGTGIYFEGKFLASRTRPLIFFDKNINKSENFPKMLKEKNVFQKHQQ